MLNNSKHILFISSWYPNRNNPTHGIFNRYFAEAASLFNKVRVLHVCSDENVYSDFEIEEDDQKIFTVTVYYKKVRSKFPFFSSILKHNRFIQAFQLGFKKIKEKSPTIDLIHLNVVMPAGIGALHLSRKYNIPYVVNENWSGYCIEDNAYKGLFQKYFTKKIISNAKVIMPTSEFLKRAMLSHHLVGNYQVVPNVVDTNIFVALENIQTEKIKFIHISSLVEREKNVSGIIRAFSNALKENKNIELEIVGEGNEKENLIRLCFELKIENKISFAGRQDKASLVKKINESAGLIMFSHFETFSLVVFETFACGKPVITTNVGAMKDYMNDRLGITVAPKNEKELTEAILKLAAGKNNYDRNFIRNFAMKCSYEIVGKQLNDIYSDALIVH